MDEENVAAVGGEDQRAPEFMEYDAIFALAMKDLEIDEQLKGNLHSLLTVRDQHYQEMAPIQKQWTAIAQSDGKYAADIWLNKEPIVAGKLQYLLKSIQSIDVQIELEKERATKEKQKVAQDIARSQTLVCTLLEKVPIIKLKYTDLKRNKTRNLGFRRLGSYRALQESIKEAFPNCKYELTWCENVIDSEDSFVITLEEHIQKAEHEKYYNVSTLVLELELLIINADDQANGSDDDADEFEKSNSSSSDEDDRPPIVNQTGKWTTAEKIRLREGLRKFKTDFKAVASIVGTRTNKQVSNFLTKHPKFARKKKRSKKLDMDVLSDRDEKLAKWLDNSSVVANRITAEHFKSGKTNVGDAALSDDEEEETTATVKKN